MASEPPCADPHAGWCGEGWRETGPYPIIGSSMTESFGRILLTLLALFVFDVLYATIEV
jgi:hypothetical protein